MCRADLCEGWPPNALIRNVSWFNKKDIPYETDDIAAERSTVPRKHRLAYTAPDPSCSGVARVFFYGLFRDYDRLFERD